jgi:predicted PolB exonuclease-like 3'-5' exonuclease
MRLVFDLECIRDEALPWEPKEPDQFPPPVHHRIVAIGYCWLKDDWSVVRMGVLGPDELDAVATFTAEVRERCPQLIGFNSRRYDVPVLVARCFRHGRSTGWAQRYGNRYKPDIHADISDWLTNYGAAPPTKLDTWARAMGLPGKRGVDGGDVAELWAAGRWEEIASYCLEDVVTTALVAVRARGGIDGAPITQGIIEAAEKESRLYGWCGEIDRALVLPYAAIAAE